MGKIKDFKTKDCKTLFGKIIQRLMFHQLTQLVVAAALVLISAIAFGFTDDGTVWNSFFSGMYSVGLIFLALFAVVAIIFAWIINPLRRWLKKK